MPAWVYLDNNMDVIDSFNVNISPKMSYGVLEYDIML